MRAPSRHRPMVRQLTTKCLSLKDQQAMAAQVRYVGSPEHKDTPSFAGKLPKPRPDASICDRSFADEQAQLTSWLKEAMARGAIGEMMEGRFPRYAWYKDGNTVYEARLVNREQGTYKGYPLLEDEWPEGIGKRYE